jgi:hypothetical protein
VALAAVVVLAGCGGSSDGTPPKPEPSRAEAVIRGWTEAVYDGDYDRAADFFAGDAVVQQQGTIILRTHEDAKAFSKSLPCRAKVTSIERERRGALLASFDLFPGKAGTCPEGGNARVRFFVRGGRIEAWRQLPESPEAPSQTS